MKTRKGRYDRNSQRQVDYAVRAVRRCADHIRALHGAAVAPPTPGNGDKLVHATAIIAELRPLITKMKASAWKQTMLGSIDKVLG